MIDKKLLQSLEDITDQYGRNKCKSKDVIESLNNIVKYYKKPIKITYAQIRSFTDQFDGNCSDGWIQDILNGDVNIDKMKTFILNNYQEHQDENGNKLLDEDIEGYFTKDNCKEIYNKESKQ